MRSGLRPGAAPPAPLARARSAAPLSTSITLSGTRLPASQICSTAGSAAAQGACGHVGVCVCAGVYVHACTCVHVCLYVRAREWYTHMHRSARGRKCALLPPWQEMFAAPPMARNVCCSPYGKKCAQVALWQDMCADHPVGLPTCLERHPNGQSSWGYTSGCSSWGYTSGCS